MFVPCSSKKHSFLPIYEKITDITLDRGRTVLFMNTEPHMNATFYHYQLLKKVIYPKAIIFGCLVLPLLFLIIEMLALGPLSLLYFIIAAPIALWIQFVICRSVLIIVNQSYQKLWGFSWQLPWLGYMPGPEQYTRYKLFKQTYTHCIWIGIVIPAIIIPWSPFPLVISMLFWHLWLLLPRIFAFSTVQHQRKDGIFKFNGQELSYYIQ